MPDEDQQSKRLKSAWNEWWLTLTQAERDRLVSSGAFNPDKPDDAEVSDARSIVNDMPIFFWPNRPIVVKGNKLQTPSAADEVQANEDSNDGKTYYTQDDLDLISERLRSLFLFLLEGLDDSSDQRMKVKAHTIRIVLGFEPMKQADVAKAYKIHRQSISAECRKLLRRLGFSNSAYMRAENKVQTMRRSYILRNLNDGQNHKKMSHRDERAQGIFLVGQNGTTPPPTEIGRAHV